MESDRQLNVARFRRIKILLAIGLVASALHFLDNAFELSHYTGPPWLTTASVIEAWLVVSLVGVVALTRRSCDRVFLISAGLYALILMSGLLHYAYGSPAQMDLRSNFTVLFEAATGAVLAIALTRSRFSIP